MKDDNKSYFEPCPKCGSTGFCECMADNKYYEATNIKLPFNYIFHRDGKWWTFNAELPVKPNDPLQYGFTVEMDEYVKAISDLMDSAILVKNPELLLAFKRDVTLQEWPGTVKIEDEQVDTAWFVKVAHLVLPEGDFKPVYMDQDTVPTERMTPPEEKNMKTENREKVVREFADVINKNSLENRSNTPDFILAEYLVCCLESFDKTSRHREDQQVIAALKELIPIAERIQKACEDGDTKCYDNEYDAQDAIEYKSAIENAKLLTDGK